MKNVDLMKIVNLMKIVDLMKILLVTILFLFSNVQFFASEHLLTSYCIFVILFENTITIFMEETAWRLHYNTTI